MDSNTVTIHFFFILLRDEIKFRQKAVLWEKKSISFTVPLLLFK